MRASLPIRPIKTYIRTTLDGHRYLSVVFFSPSLFCAASIPPTILLPLLLLVAVVVRTISNIRFHTFFNIFFSFGAILCDPLCVHYIQYFTASAVFLLNIFISKAVSLIYLYCLCVCIYLCLGQCASHLTEFIANSIEIFTSIIL